jgi:hypothetical protein
VYRWVVSGNGRWGKVRGVGGGFDEQESAGE